ncbi:MAG: hypothetical protein AAGE38_02920 [Pseudomonadota bacterium]
MATKFRGTAMIEPDYVEPPRRSLGARLVRLIVGLSVGLLIAAWFISNPWIWGRIAEVFQTRLVSNLPVDYQQFAPWVALALLAILAIILKRFILNGLVYTAILGAFLWVPFGNHLMATTPLFEQTFPNLRAGLDSIISNSPPLAQIRTTAEASLPVEQIAAEEATVATQ